MACSNFCVCVKFGPELCASGAKYTVKMVPLVQVSLCSSSSVSHLYWYYAMLLYMTYSARHYSYLKLWAEERMVAKRKMRLDELKLMRENARSSKWLHVKARCQWACLSIVPEINKALWLYKKDWSPLTSFTPFLPPLLTLSKHWCIDVYLRDGVCGVSFSGN